MHFHTGTLGISFPVAVNGRPAPIEFGPVACVTHRGNRDILTEFMTAGPSTRLIMLLREVHPYSDTTLLSYGLSVIKGRRLGRIVYNTQKST